MADKYSSPSLCIYDVRSWGVSPLPLCLSIKMKITSSTALTIISSFAYSAPISTSLRRDQLQKRNPLGSTITHLAGAAENTLHIGSNQIGKLHALETIGKSANAAANAAKHLDVSVNSNTIELPKVSPDGTLKLSDPSYLQESN